MGKIYIWINDNQWEFSFMNIKELRKDEEEWIIHFFSKRSAGNLPHFTTLRSGQSHQSSLFDPWSRPA